MLNWLPTAQRCKVINFTFKHINYTYASGSDVNSSWGSKAFLLDACAAFVFAYSECVSLHPFHWNRSCSTEWSVQRCKKKNKQHFQQPKKKNTVHTICLFFTCCKQERKMIQFLSTIFFPRLHHSGLFFCCTCFMQIRWNDAQRPNSPVKLYPFIMRGCFSFSLRSSFAYDYDGSMRRS